MENTGHSAMIIELKEKIQYLRDNKLLPKNYAKTISERIPNCSPKKVYNTLAGGNSDLEIMEAIIELAENNKEKELLERLNKLLDAKD